MRNYPGKSAPESGETPGEDMSRFEKFSLPGGKIFFIPGKSDTCGTVKNGVESLAGFRKESNAPGKGQRGRGYILHHRINPDPWRSKFSLPVLSAVFAG